MTRFYAFLLASSSMVISACTPELPAPHDEFWGRLNALCGNAYEGELVSEDAQDADLASGDIWMDVSSCEGKEVIVDFMNGEEAVGHWVLTKRPAQIELRHIHEGDAVTGYGGYSTGNSSGARMNFPADEATKALFDREGIPVSKANVWAVEVRPTVFAYELQRPERFFRVEFDTTSPISAE
ncbi:MAG: hypothetical protein CMK06_12440 [Ponticaulis sp.]|nr:hypothetical protein [Ponticaulis sp.]